MLDIELYENLWSMSIGQKSIEVEVGNSFLLLLGLGRSQDKSEWTKVYYANIDHLKEFQLVNSPTEQK